MLEATFDFYRYSCARGNEYVSYPESVSINLRTLSRTVYKDVLETNTLHLMFNIDGEELIKIAPYFEPDILRRMLVRFSVKEASLASLNGSQDTFKGYVSKTKIYKGYRIYSKADANYNYAKIQAMDVEMLITGICDADWQALVG